jgi:hypothetical protein
MDEIEDNGISEDEAIANLCERLNDEVDTLRARIAAVEALMRWSKGLYSIPVALLSAALATPADAGECG